ncbi:MAG: peptidylprolyl isomerase [Candidatus Cloacimonetes bacterium]|nr:peptidylprolyl isomerase [Candidatus Cloacimonadota bacterium]MBL7086150.1 peptidylprolyl isomerase [Candidatus Cloacimonadota bacterium]
MLIAIVNDYKIFDTEYKAELYQLMIERSAEESTRELKELAINKLIDACLLKEESQKYNFQIDEQEVHHCFLDIQNQYLSSEEFLQIISKFSLTPEKLIENIRNNLCIKQFIRIHFLEKIKIDNTQIREYYQRHKNNFIIPEEIRLYHILISGKDPYTFQKIDELSRRLYQNYDFCKLAKDYSDCPSSVKGGDLGYFPRGRILKELEKIAFTIPIGETAGPIKTRFGYHFIKLIDKRKARIPEFKEIKYALKKQLKKLMAELELLKFVRSRRSKAHITIHYEYL